VQELRTLARRVAGRIFRRQMARRSIWTGAISFGLVNVPVSLFSAVEQKEVHFNLIHEPDGGRINQKRVCQIDGAEVPWDEVAKGYPLSKRKMVMITKEELEAVDPRATRTIDIIEFVDASEISPLFYDHSYYVAPASEAAQKAYALLREAMTRGGKVALAQMVMRTKQYLCALRAEGKVLVLTTMQYADEIRDPAELDLVPDTTKVPERELDLAERLIDSLAAKFEPQKFEDDYRAKVLALIERKAEGEQIEVPAGRAEAEPEVVSLEEALAASLGRRADRVQRAATARKRRPAAATRKRQKKSA
jgi:DNA end-binding protein Ku